MDPNAHLKDIGATVRTRFQSQQRVLSFDEYLTLFLKNPWRHSRDASRYLRDCMDWYGAYDVERAGGSVKRWRLFDLDFSRPAAGGDEARERHDYLVGQERVQAALYRILSNFVREGRTNRLILLHGPNGSAKSTLVGCLMQAMEHYSQQDEGALYRFSWIFPRGSDGKAIGFGSRDELPSPGDSFAHLPDSRIDVKLTSELRENPLVLLPPDERRLLAMRAFEEQGVSGPLPHALTVGQLGHKNQQIFEALLTAYRGELARVLAHVRVERYYVSRRYRVGAVTLGPEMAVDAKERQISVDRSLGALPASLSALSLYETVGELVDASGGLLEYSDLLKRPLDAWRYLLLAIETGEVSLSFSTLPLNCVLLASSNELHLNAFREHHEYRSFRGRLQPVRVPYLLDYRLEQGIYDSQLIPQVGTHTAPHATYVAALWAVLTRMRRPQASGYDNEALGKVAAGLSPLEKAELYADARLPPRLESEESRLLDASIDAVAQESDAYPIYEGLSGASPREIRNLLLDAAQDARYTCLSPLAVLDHIERLCESEDYEFLKEEPDEGYHDHRGFIAVVRERWLDRADEEFRGSTGLVEETQYTELFARYVTHVSYWTKGEQLLNELTGEYEEPDPALMGSVEDMLEIKADIRDTFRSDLINTVAAQAIDHPGVPIDYVRAFPRQHAKLRNATYKKRTKQLAVIAEDVLQVLSVPDDTGMDAARRTQAEETIQRMEGEHGYIPASAQDAIGELLRRRYATD